MIRLYEEIVGRGGVSPAHFFYDMTFAEAAAFIRGQSRKDQEDWERTRQIMWSAIMPHSKNPKEFDVRDVMKFAWEETNEVCKESDERERERIRNIAKNMKL